MSEQSPEQSSQETRSGSASPEPRPQFQVSSIQPLRGRFPRPAAARSRSGMQHKVPGASTGDNIDAQVAFGMGAPPS
jgi:hypothetical protein